MKRNYQRLHKRLVVRTGKLQIDTCKEFYITWFSRKLVFLFICFLGLFLRGSYFFHIFFLLLWVGRGGTIETSRTQRTKDNSCIREKCESTERRLANIE